MFLGFCFVISYVIDLSQYCSLANIDVFVYYYVIIVIFIFLFCLVIQLYDQ